MNEEEAGKLIPPPKERYLKYLNTRPLITKLHELEDQLEILMKDEATFKTHNYGYTGDAAEVKRIEAELAVRAIGTNDTQRKTWLVTQRKENLELLAALTRQKVVAFDHDNLRIKMEMTKKRLEGIKAVLALKTAQLNFLAGD